MHLLILVQQLKRQFSDHNLPAEKGEERSARELYLPRLLLSGEPSALAAF
jgi:hypothetical protein